MFDNAAIDVAIGLIMMYLMLSLLCTVVNEFIATKLSLRANTLRDALQKLIDDKTLRDNFYAHGMIASSILASRTGWQSTLDAVVKMFSGSSTATTPTDKDHPSYMASGTVALALMGSLVKQNGGTVDFKGVETAINALTGDPKIKDALKASLLKANGDIDKLQQSIAAWFDDSMDRLSGAYKRKVKWIAMLIGLVVAIAFNADSFNVAKTLWNDPERRAAIVAVATDTAKNPPARLQAADQKQPSDAAQPGGQKQPPAGPKQPGDAKNTTANDVDAAVKETEQALRSLPIGWNCPAGADGKVDYVSCAQQAFNDLSLVHFLGWILTALALSLGAPFWFDMLNKFINLRGAGDKPQREDQK
jgi:hypothetical protein